MSKIALPKFGDILELTDEWTFGVRITYDANRKFANVTDLIAPGVDWYDFMDQAIPMTFPEGAKVFLHRMEGTRLHDDKYNFVTLGFRKGYIPLIPLSGRIFLKVSFSDFCNLPGKVVGNINDE